MMTDDEVRTFIAQMSTSWPRAIHVSAEVWMQELRNLDAGTAGTALVRLRRELEHPPSVAKFRAMYFSLNTRATDPLPNDCDVCGGDGWVTREYQRGERTYRGAYPCTCPTGQENQRIWDDISTANERQRKALNFEP